MGFGGQTWQQAPLPTEPSHLPSCPLSLFLIILASVSTVQVFLEILYYNPLYHSTRVRDFYVVLLLKEEVQVRRHLVAIKTEAVLLKLTLCLTLYYNEALSSL